MRHWWHQRSLRFRLAAWYAVGGILLLALYSAALYWLVAARMAQPLDHQLRKDAQAVAAQLSLGPEGQMLWRGHALPQTEGWSWQDPWFELWDNQGQLVCRRWPFTQEQVEQHPVAPPYARETISVFRIAGELRLRTLALPWQGEPRSSGLMLRVMSLHEPAADALSSLLWVMVLAAPVGVLALVTGGYAITRFWLRPFDAMVAAAGQVSASDPGRRLPVENPHDELGRLAGVFNVTLERLESAYAALDRFVADASHELRTPLTTLRSVGEVGLRRSRSEAEYREIVGSMLEEARRVQTLTERLLELARAESEHARLQREWGRLDEWVRAAVNEAAILAEAKGQELVLKLEEQRIFSDPMLVRQALLNLLENAIKYSPDETRIVVCVSATDTELHVAVQDQGPGIAPEHRPYIMDRFYRSPALRGRSRGGFGLGLAISRAYVRSLGGRLEYEPVPEGGSVFRLVLPRGAHTAAVNTP